MTKETRHKITRSILFVLAGLLLLALPVSYILSQGQARYAVLPYKTIVKIERSSPRSSFLRTEEIIKELPFSIEDSVSSPVRIGELERTLSEKIAYLKRAEVFISPSARTLNIRVIERTPILRYYRGGKAYFLDEEGVSVPGRVGAAALVPIATGNLTDSVITSTVYPLASYLSQSNDYRTFFPFIDVLSGRQIRLYPRIGDYVFELHGVATLSEDLSKVPLFYKKIVPQVGANKYSLVKLSYKDQIICTRREDADK